MSGHGLSLDWMVKESLTETCGTNLFKKGILLRLRANHSIASKHPNQTGLHQDLNIWLAENLHGPVFMQQQRRNLHSVWWQLAERQQIRQKRHRKALSQIYTTERLWEMTWYEKVQTIDWALLKLHNIKRLSQMFLIPPILVQIWNLKANQVAESCQSHQIDSFTTLPSWLSVHLSRTLTCSVSNPKKAPFQYPTSRAWIFFRQDLCNCVSPDI